MFGKVFGLFDGTDSEIVPWNMETNINGTSMSLANYEVDRML